MTIHSNILAVVDYIDYINPLVVFWGVVDRVIVLLLSSAIVVRV